MRIRARTMPAALAALLLSASALITHAQDAPKPPAKQAGAFLGVMTAPVPPALKAHLRLADGEGVLVTGIVEGSPAERAEIKQYDVLLAVNGRKVESTRQLAELMRALDAGDIASLTLISGGETYETEGTLAARSENPNVIRPGGTRTMLTATTQPNVTNDPALRRQLADAGLTDAQIKAVLADLQKAVQNAPMPTFQFTTIGNQGDAAGTVVVGGGQAGGAAVTAPQAFSVNVTTGAKGGVMTTATGTSTVVMTGANGVSSRTQDDGEHKLTLSTDAGRKRLVATDKAGKVLFDGPVDTAEQRKAVPEALRAKLAALEAQAGGMSVQFGGAAEAK